MRTEKKVTIEAMVSKSESASSEATVMTVTRCFSSRAAFLVAIVSASLCCTSLPNSLSRRNDSK